MESRNLIKSYIIRGMPCPLYFRFNNKVLLLALNFLLDFVCLAQNSIGYRIQKNDVGVNHNFYFSKTVKTKTVIEVGVRLHQNVYQPPPVVNIYRDMFWARKTIEHIGVSLGYRKNYKLNEYVIPFVFIDMQISRLSLRYNDRQIEYINGKFITSNEFTFYDIPHFNIETNIGLGFEFKLSKYYSIVQRTGVGVAFFFFKKQYYDPLKNKTITQYGLDSEGWEFTKMLSLGIVKKLK